jgi:hypothetical protein
MSAQALFTLFHLDDPFPAFVEQSEQEFKESLLLRPADKRAEDVWL